MVLVLSLQKKRNIMDNANSYQLTILFALGRTGKHVYAGTVDPEVVAKRRAANKVARKQRKRNR